MPGTLLLTDHILIDHLQAIVMDVLPVDQQDVLGHTVVPLQDLNKILLNLRCLLHDVIVGICDTLGKETLPLIIAETIIVERFQLGTEVGDQFRVDGEIGIALVTEHTDKLRLQCRLALIGVRALAYRFILRDHRVLIGLGNNVEIGHSQPPILLSLKRQ